MNFWDIFYDLCSRNNIKPNPLGKKLGFSSGTMTLWKNGTIPNGETLKKIADYFNCSVDYLLGRTDTPNVSGDLDSKEKRLVAAYRNKPEMQMSVDILLGLSDGEFNKKAIDEPGKTVVAKIAAFGGGVSTKVYKEGEIDEEKIRKLAKEREVKDDF
ncbi:MAG: helix-turn-helix transcriptional regulator [Clostridia bacterium]|nr:helix-turn-helix transcriptional regulator [Clostridia bacterium]